MSINSAMLAGVSGLTANSAALAAISDNIANVNTVGYKRSSSAFQTIVTRNPDSAAGHAGVGLALIQLRSYDEAVTALERALQLDPGNARYRQTLTRARDFLKASKAFERTGQENLQRMLGDQPGKKREP